ncbi:hypothetical protein NUW58_g2697 [Xylaria curta]|uniref:Uncharacterized protein n=1 Tax=Xylaria curta TaxID=42375 RepID=A0ACC1PH11_9PEZI|nr:hypothetical protein NUW58_g2697 [Xylaria curta]
MENMIDAAEGAAEGLASLATTEDETLTDILLGFLEEITARLCSYLPRTLHLVGCRANDQGVHGELRYRVRTIIKLNDVLVTGFNFGCGSPRKKAAISILANQVPLLVACSFGSTFGCNAYKLLWDVLRSKATITEQDSAS